MPGETQPNVPTPGPNPAVKPKAIGPKSKRRKIIIILLIIAVLVAAGLIGYIVFGPEKESTNKNTVQNTNNRGTQVRRAIDGVWDVPANERRQPVGVMIENLATIRPQAGLDKANIVYEALAEGGITRFLALYTLTESIDDIGPVRSARPYFVDWNQEHGALYAHAGGSPQALSDIVSKGVYDLNQFSHPENYIRKKMDRAIEHTLFTSSKLLIYAMRDKEATAASNFTPWKFKEDSTLNERPLESTPIVINFSSASYQVTYKYNRTTNTYDRFYGDEPHGVMGESDLQLSPKNVVVAYMETSQADESRLAIETDGSGKALLFRDGQVITGRWSKSGSEQRTEFTDANGAALTFNAGQTWIEVVPTDRQVTY